MVSLPNYLTFISVDKLLKFYLVAGVACFLGSISACTNYNEEELYPKKVACGTFAISYSQTVRPILQRECTGCHTGNAPSGNVALDTHAQVKTVADHHLMAVLNHEPGHSPMPAGGNKLPACDLAKIQAWVDAGASNN